MNGPRKAAGTPFDKQSQVEESLAEIREALLALRFGAIAITVHDDRVVQIDVTERKRLKPI